ncbi:alpha/beta fold hydrolase [Streptomyces adonidis]|uniref:alpha/beta fold hydrolase n=1 Tax=Streptomyces adonidis TaxID=3231367 RepID=UPI0034DAC3DC
MTIVQDVRGTGPTAIAVLSGWFGRDSLYDSMLAGIDLDAFTLALVDYRGYGPRKAVEGAYDLAEICEDVIAGVDELGWGSFGLLAHSMAGPAAALVASAVPDRVTGYLGVSPVPPSGVPFDEQTRELFASAAGSTDVRAGIIDLSTGHRCPPAWVNGLARRSAEEARPDAFAKYLDAWADADVEEQFRGLDIPIRVIVGENDLALTRELVDATFVKLQPSTEAVTFANCGHYAMVEAPLALAASIQEFFGAKAGTSGPADGAGH